jgi:hypothetical protein
MAGTWDSAGRLDQMVEDERVPRRHFGSLARQDAGSHGLVHVAHVEETERVICMQET